MYDHSQQYAPYGKYLWNTWFFNNESDYHLFYLQIDRATNPRLRSKLPTSIGHAISKDLINWQELPQALTPSPIGSAWDDYALWSGSVIKKDTTYYLYYTGKNAQPEYSNTQKICLATSPDLSNWKKHSQNPILETDARYYDASGLIFKGGTIGAWRDPFVFKDPHSEKRYMTISARDKALTSQFDACVALAYSHDLVQWEVLPPIFSPGIFSEINLTQVIYHQDRYYLFFTTSTRSNKSPTARKNDALDGLYCYYSKNLLGGYQPVNGNGIVFDTSRAGYDIHVFPHRDNEFIGVGWLDTDKTGQFIGKVAKPIKLKIQNDQIFVIN